MSRMSNKRFSELQKIIVGVLKEMDSRGGKRGVLHTRWIVQDEVCKRYMEHFGMTGYDPAKMSNNIKDHPEWKENPKLKHFFIVERSTDSDRKQNVYLKDSPSFSSSFLKSIINLLHTGLVKVDNTYQRNKAVCCGYTSKRDEDIVGEPHQLKDIQMIGLTENAYLS